MRRAQSVRHYSRPSIALGADDLGMLKESPDESNEDVLRRQLIERDRECDKLQTQVQILQAQLAQRPPLEKIQELEREYKNLDLLLQGTQRENERCMAELERGKSREKMLEREIEKLAGSNWQTSLGISPTTSYPRSTGIPQHTHTRTSSHPSSSSLTHSTTIPPQQQRSSPHSQPQQVTQEQHLQVTQTLSHIEQVRLLILGIEQRLQTREDKLDKCVQRAEEEGRRFEEMRKTVV
ncbi:hypothetical protein JAAARDRAFT_146812 [Jaapia argillacea MUCL 33604]|uniref:Uncharacterized protein n=1 Tax=Jaapia argillacea MUCL 33604 TaxID=933084 RepID=A0A067QA03_9AGAM|nr:hypothetical protein JAAARDRAFT_146812 [Jaapia argillacea MUCL 33604]